MNITNKKENLFQLWLYSFQVVNRSIGKLILVILCSVFLLLVVVGALMLCFGTAGVLAKMNMMMLSKTVGFGAVMVYLLTMLASNLFGLFFVTVCWQVLGSQAEESPLPLAEAFSGAVMPTLYQFVTLLLISVPVMILMGLVSLLRNPILSAVVMVSLFITLGVRLCYSLIAIGLAHKGPIEGIKVSWTLTQGKGFVDAFLMCLMTVGTVLLMELFYAAIAYGAFIIIPLHFASGFQLAHLSAGWILAALMLLLVGMFVYFVAIAFPVIVFLNRYAVTDNATGIEKDTTFVPLPGVVLPDISENPAHAQDAQSTLRIPHPQTPKQPNPEVQVLQASINTSEEETTDLSQHLDQVYTPKKEDVVQYVDEDRMPTILFDDEMAKQLQEGSLPSPKKTEKPDKKEGDDSVKMSEL